MEVFGIADFARGAKAGVVSGAIYGPINWLIINIGIALINGDLGNWVTHIMTDGIWFLDCIIKNLISGLIFGLILGLIFAAVYDKLPGKTPTIKGIVISIIYWVTIPLGLPVLSYLSRWGFEGLYWEFVYAGTWKATTIALGTSIIWGWLLGYFWESDWLGKLYARMSTKFG